MHSISHRQVCPFTPHASLCLAAWVNTCPFQPANSSREPLNTKHHSPGERDKTQTKSKSVRGGAKTEGERGMRNNSVVWLLCTQTGSHYCKQLCSSLHIIQMPTREVSATHAQFRWLWKMGECVSLHPLWVLCNMITTADSKPNVRAEGKSICHLV